MELTSRAKAILRTPRAEWTVIDTEPATIGGLYSWYILPLAAIGPVAGFIGQAIIGWSSNGIATRLPIGTAFTDALVRYAVSLAGVYLFALAIDVLAPTFGGERSPMQAMKVAAYSGTAFWIANACALIPALFWLNLLGFYGFYLVYAGLPIVMKSRADKALAYTIACIIAGGIIWSVLAVITRALVPGFLG